jgi:hypothetical protein
MVRVMANPTDPLENVRRITAQPAFLRQLREATEIGRRLSGYGVASNLDRVRHLFPMAAQRSAINVGTEVTRLLAGSTAVTAWAEAQSASAHLAELMQPKIATPALGYLDELSRRLTANTRVLAGLQMPQLLQQATADSSRGWRLVVDGLTIPAFDLPATKLAGSFAVGTTVSARVLRPALVEPDEADDVIDLDERGSAELVDALSIGDEFRQEIRARLGALDQRLLDRWDGAWSTLVAAGPDGPSQAAHSIQELIDWTLRLAAPTERVMAWRAASGGGSPEDLDKSGNPTRGCKVRYIVGERDQDKAAKLFTSSLNKIVEALQDAKHGFTGPTGPFVIRSVLLNVESFLGFLLVNH